MSLGVKSIWGAQSGNPGLSLILRGQLSQSVSRLPVSSHGIRQLSARSLKDNLVAGTGAAVTAKDEKPQSSKGVVSPVTLVDRLVSLPVRQHGARESVLVEPRIEYPHRGETLRSERRNHQGVTAQLRLERIRAAQCAPPPNWRAVLHNLTVWTPKYSADSVEISLPEEAAKLLLSDAGDNVWDIQSRTGVSMKLEEPGSAGDGCRTLLLSGDSRSIDNAIDDILNVAKQVTRVLLSRPIAADGGIPHSPEGQETNSNPPVTIRETRTDLVRPYVLTTRVEDIPKPSSWTKTSFEEYVIALTMGRMPSNLASSLYQRGSSHDEAVIRQLHHIFNDPTARQALSSSAFKMALAFMARKGHTFRPHSRALFVRAELFGMPMDTEVFNILAESAVKARDLRGFSTTINLMVRRGHRPNLRTWILFLRLIKSEEVKRYILHAMNHTQLLNSPSAVRQVAKEMASHDIDRAIQQGKDLKTFLADQDTLYGRNWLSRDAANKIIEILGRHGRFDDCGEFLDVMAGSTSAQPDIITLNTILTHCKIQNNLHKAVDMLERFETTAPSVVPDSITYHLLSELGWRHKLPHVTGLIWRYSCLVNRTSYRMRRRAADLLRGSIKAPAPTTSSLPEAVGPGPQMRALLVNEVMSDASGARADTAVVTHPTSGTEAMHQVLRRYGQMHRDWEPAAPLGALLREALARDARLRGRTGADEVVGEVGPVPLPTRRRRGRQGGVGVASAASGSGLGSGQGERKRQPGIERV